MSREVSNAFKRLESLYIFERKATKGHLAVRELKRNGSLRHDCDLDEVTG